MRDEYSNIPNSNCKDQEYFADTQVSVYSRQVILAETSEDRFESTSG